MRNADQEYVTAAQVAELLGYTKKTVSNWVKLGKIPAPDPRFLPRLKWKREDIEKWQSEFQDTYGERG